MFVTYVLRLEDGCYYIAVTHKETLDERVEKHFKGQGNDWTKRHKPIKLASVHQGDHEKRLCLKAFAKFGRDKVRSSRFYPVKTNQSFETDFTYKISRR